MSVSLTARDVCTAPAIWLGLIVGDRSGIPELIGVQITRLEFLALGVHDLVSSNRLLAQQLITGHFVKAGYAVSPERICG